MKALLFALTLSFGFIGQAHAATAGDDGETRFGEIHLTLANASYCKVEVDGEDWSGTEFERKGKLLLIKGLALVGDRYSVTLTPFDDKLAPVSFEVGSDDFKKRRKGRYYFFVVTKTIRFDRAKNMPVEPQPKPQKEPTPKPQPDDDDYDL